MDDAGKLIYTGLPEFDATADFEPISVEECAQQIAEVCALDFGVNVDWLFIRDHLSPLCSNIKPSRFLVKTILRSDLMKEFVGDTLAKTLRIYEFRRTFDMAFQPPPSISMQELMQELIDAKSSIGEAKNAAQIGDARRVSNVLGVGMTLTKVDARRNLSRPLTAASEEKQELRDRIKLATVDMAMSLKQAFKHVPETLGAASSLISLMTYGQVPSSTQQQQALENALSRYTVGRHCLVVDSALDLLVQASHDITILENDTCHLLFKPNENICRYIILLS